MSLDVCMAEIRLPDSMSGSLYFKHFRKLGDLGHTGYNFVHKLTGIIAKDTRISKLVSFRTFGVKRRKNCIERVRNFTKR